MTKSFTVIELKSVADEGLKSMYTGDKFNLPCHTQAVERGVKVKYNF